MDNSSNSSDTGGPDDSVNDSSSNSSPAPSVPTNSSQSISRQGQSGPGPPASTSASPQTVTSSTNSSDLVLTPIPILTNDLPTLVNTCGGGCGGVEGSPEGSCGKCRIAHPNYLGQSTPTCCNHTKNVASTEGSQKPPPCPCPFENASNNSELSPSEAAAFEAQIQAADRQIGLISPANPQNQRQQQQVNDQNGGHQQGEMDRSKFFNPPYPITTNDPGFWDPRRPTLMVTRTGPGVNSFGITDNVQRRPILIVNPPTTTIIDDQTRLLIAQIANNYFESNKAAIYQHISNLMIAQMTQFMTNHLVTIVDTLNKQGQWPWRFCQCGSNNFSGQQQQQQRSSQGSGGRNFLNENPAADNSNQSSLPGHSLPYPSVPNPPLVGQRLRQDCFPVVGKVRNSVLTNNSLRQNQQPPPTIAVTPPPVQNQTNQGSGQVNPPQQSMTTNNSSNLSGPSPNRSNVRGLVRVPCNCPTCPWRRNREQGQQQQQQRSSPPPLDASVSLDVSQMLNELR